MGTLLSTEQFISRAKKKYYKYDFSLVIYKHSGKKIKIICPKHGLFEQYPSRILNGHGCQKCGIEKASTKKSSNKNDFIKKATKIYGDRYDYSKVVYKDSKTKVVIICPKHGKFEQIPRTHLGYGGCLKCGVELRTNKLRLSEKQFIEKAIKVHGNKYNYSMIGYKNCDTKIKIICKRHGIFFQTPYGHLYSRGCPKCSKETPKQSSSNNNTFIKKAIKKHGNKYDYSIIDYKRCLIKIKIICPKHGVFEQTPKNHLKGVGCPSCRESHGEQNIASFLDTYKITYQREKKFNRCKNIQPLPFDFYIPYLNTCIEYDGKQHFFPCKYFGGLKQFEKLKISDAIKNQFCLDNNIKLIRIPYTKKDPEIINLLKEELFTEHAGLNAGTDEPLFPELKTGNP
jgi:hypothetical protein